MCKLSEMMLLIAKSPHLDLDALMEHSKTRWVPNIGPPCPDNLRPKSSPPIIVRQKHEKN